LIIWLYVLRWYILVRPLGINIGFYHLLLIRQAGQAVSFITPGPQFGGEPLQIFWLWKIFSLPLHNSLLAVALDRFYELWINFAVLLFGIILLLSVPSANYADWKSIAVVILILISSLSIPGWLLIRQRNYVSDWIKKLAMRWQNNRRLMQMDTHWNTLAGRLEKFVIEDKRSLISAFLVSLLGWAGMIAELWLIMGFLDISPGVSGFVFILVAMRLAFLLPLPGGIGSLEAAMFWVFSSMDLAPAAAMGIIALMRLRDAVVLVTGLGALRCLSLTKHN
jgi:hypothetical protein